MCGNCWSKPCVKVGIAANNDTFSVLDQYRVRLGSTTYYIGDVSLDHHIPQVFIQLTSSHNIDKHIVEFASITPKPPMRVQSWVRAQLNNPHIPDATVNNRANSMIKNGFLAYYSSSSVKLTEKGWQAYTKTLRQECGIEPKLDEKECKVK